MEITRITKDGITYRIIANHPIYGLFEIETLTTYKHDDGTPCDVWKAALQPTKIFNTINEAREYINNKI